MKSIQWRHNASTSWTSKSRHVAALFGKPKVFLVGIGYPCMERRSIILRWVVLYIECIQIDVCWRHNAPQAAELEIAPQFNENRHKQSRIADNDDAEDIDSLVNEDEDDESDDDDIVLPPTTRRPVGRPKKRRIRSNGELPLRSFKCSHCGGIGHSRRTCREAIWMQNYRIGGFYGLVSLCAIL